MNGTSALRLLGANGAFLGGACFTGTKAQLS